MVDSQNRVQLLIFYNHLSWETLFKLPPYPPASVVLDWFCLSIAEFNASMDVQDVARTYGAWTWGPLRLLPHYHPNEPAKMLLWLDEELKRETVPTPSGWEDCEPFLCRPSEF